MNFPRAAWQSYYKHGWLCIFVETKFMRKKTFGAAYLMTSVNFHITCFTETTWSTVSCQLQNRKRHHWDEWPHAFWADHTWDRKWGIGVARGAKEPCLLESCVGRVNPRGLRVSAFAGRVRDEKFFVRVTECRAKARELHQLKNRKIRGCAVPSCLPALRLGQQACSSYNIMMEQPIIAKQIRL